MNDYGQRAMAYWQRHLPERFKGLDDPEAFFTELGDQVAEAVTDTWDRMVLADTPPEGERHADREARLQRLRAAAEQQVIADLVELPPEPGAAAEPDLMLESDEALQARIGEAAAHQQWRNDTCTALLDGHLSVDQLDDDQLAAIVDYAGPGFLLALGTSVEEQRGKGRPV